MRVGLGLSIPAQRGLSVAARAYARAVFGLDARFNPDQLTGTPSDVSLSRLPIQSGSAGGLDTNDPLWLPAPSTYGVTRYVYTPGSVFNHLSIPHNAAFVGDNIEIDAVFATPPLTAAPSENLWLYDHRTLATDMRWFRIDTTTGLLRFANTVASTVLTVTSSVAPTFATAVGFRASWIRDSGAGQYLLRFYQTADGVNWTQVGTDRTGPSPSNPTVTDAVTTGNPSGITISGLWRRWVVRDAPGGTVLLDWSAEDPVNSTHTSFTASTGQTVTVNRATSGRKTAVVEAAKWLLGTDDYIEVADNALLDIDAATSFTVIGVIRQMDASPVADGPWISKRAAAGTGTGWGVRTNGATLVAHAGVEDTGADEQTRTTTALTAGALSMVGFVVDRTAGTIAAVRNGALTATASLSAVGDCSNALPMRIGRQADGTVYQDFENYAWYIWREALTASELAAIAADWGAA